jgi:hypothetical protein
MKMPSIGIRSLGNSVVKVRMFIGRRISELARRISEKTVVCARPVGVRPPVRGEVATGKSLLPGCAGGMPGGSTAPGAIGSRDWKVAPTVHVDHAGCRFA